METSSSTTMDSTLDNVNPKAHLFPYSIVWTPIPLLSWLFPFIGHMGIGNSDGIIYDFAGSYYVSENAMAFGWPTSYYRLTQSKILGGSVAYNRAIRQAAEEYKSHTHNLITDNCHSFVALALNLMKYDGKTNWNMMTVCMKILCHGQYVGIEGFLKQTFALFVWTIVFVYLLYLKFI